MAQDTDPAPHTVAGPSGCRLAASTGAGRAIVVHCVHAQCSPKLLDRPNGQMSTCLLEPALHLSGILHPVFSMDGLSPRFGAFSCVALAYLVHTAKSAPRREAARVPPLNPSGPALMLPRSFRLAQRLAQRRDFFTTLPCTFQRRIHIGPLLAVSPFNVQAAPSPLALVSSMPLVDGGLTARFGPVRFCTLSVSSSTAPSPHSQRRYWQ